MTFDRQGTGLAITRIALGVFFFFEGLGKYRWFTHPALLAGQLADWFQHAAPGSMSARYLEHVAIPFASYASRLVPLGEMTCGLALILGIWTPLAACAAFLLALNFQIANGAVFRYAFLTSGYGLPVLGPTLGLTIGGVRLPWSTRS